MTYTVSDVARISGVTVRTLHHYDEIGVLSPSDRSDAGYRLYDDRDLERLQHVLFLRELGITLADIRTVLDDPAFDRASALRDQRDMLVAKTERLQKVIAAVDAAINAEEMGVMLSKEDMFGVFGDFDPSEYEEKVQERWGGTPAFEESRRRTSQYTKDDWKQIMAEGEPVQTGFIEALRTGKSPTDREVMDLAEQHRLQIDRWFYPCSHEMHRNLGEMYLADARFTEHYERQAEGLARYVRDAIVANAERGTDS